MTAKITQINQFGLPRIALDSPPVQASSFIATRPAAPSVLDATASIGPGETVIPKTTAIAKTRTKPRTSTNVPRNGSKTASIVDSHTR